jgi:hypothetical protein
LEIEMKNLFALIALLPMAALATPPEWACNDKDCIRPNPPGQDRDPTVVTSTANALAASAATATAEQMQQQAQRQLQAQQQAQFASGGNAVSEGSSASAVTGASTSSATAGDSTSNATGGDASANVGAVTATLGSVVESGAVQSSTTVQTNYREAAQAVGLVLTTACGTGATASGREFTFAVAQGQDAFCKNLALANLYLSLGQQEKALTFIANAEQLADIDTFFDNFTTIISLGLLK